MKKYKQFLNESKEQGMTDKILEKAFKKYKDQYKKWSFDGRDKKISFFNFVSVELGRKPTSTELTDIYYLDLDRLSNNIYNAASDLAYQLNMLH